MIRRADERLRRMWARVGLRARLEAFIVLALLPLVGLVFFLTLQERDQEIKRARQSMVVLAERGAAQHTETLRQVHGVLRMLTLVPEVRMALPEECIALLKQTTALNPWATGFSVVHPNGQLLCDSDDRTLSIADRAYFQHALATKEFTVSDYLVGRTSGKPVVIAVLPTLNDVGKIDRILLAGVDLQWFAGLATEAARASGGVVTLLDAQGTVLARQPDEGEMLGQSMAGHPTVKTILASPTGMVEGMGLDNTPRIIGFAALGNSGARLAVGVSRDAVVAAIDRQLLVSTGVLVAVVLVVVIGVWILMEVSVLRGLRDLQASAARLSSEHFDAMHPCAPARVHAGEIGEVVQAVRSMGRELRSFAYQDRLTGLPNRRALDAHMERLTAHAQTASSAAVLYVDLDGFKPVNDQHGHHVGDAVLEEVGARLARCVRGGDMAARIGGDEFAVVVSTPNGAPAHTAQDVASRIIESMAQPFLTEGKEIRIGCSIGIALWPADGQNLDHVLRRADQALYAAKRAGRGRAVLSDGAHTHLELPT